MPEGLTKDTDKPSEIYWQVAGGYELQDRK